MKLPFCEIVLKKIHFPAPFCPTKLNRPAEKAKKPAACSCASSPHTSVRHHHAHYNGVCAHAALLHATDSRVNDGVLTHAIINYQSVVPNW
jgi:hypothetical protein